jgi:hypothetical protein
LAIICKIETRLRSAELWRDKGRKKMKKFLAILAFVVIGLMSGCPTAQTESTINNGIITVSVGRYSWYQKDTNATPPLCYYVTGNGNGWAPTLVPCANLKHYFGE